MKSVTTLAAITVLALSFSGCSYRSASGIAVPEQIDASLNVLNSFPTCSWECILQSKLHVKTKFWFHN